MELLPQQIGVLSPDVWRTFQGTLEGGERIRALLVAQTIKRVSVFVHSATLVVFARGTPEAGSNPPLLIPPDDERIHLERSIARLAGAFDLTSEPRFLEKVALKADRAAQGGAST